MDKYEDKIQIFLNEFGKNADNNLIITSRCGSRGGSKGAAAPNNKYSWTLRHSISAIDHASFDGAV